MKTVDELLKTFINNESKELLLGMNTIVESLRPPTMHSMSVSNGKFFINYWRNENEEPPSSEELTNEYVRQQSITEFYNYLKNEQPEVFELLMKKLGYTD